jgi:hypothetical protein
LIRTEKTDAPSFTKNFLQEHEHPVVNLIAKAREVNKAHTTFIDSILRYEHKGRIHAEINQLRNAGGGTVTGRFSYQNPNLQQIPASVIKILDLRLDLYLFQKRNIHGVVLITHSKNHVLLYTMQLYISYLQCMMLWTLTTMIQTQTFTRP